MWCWKHLFVGYGFVPVIEDADVIEFAEEEWVYVSADLFLSNLYMSFIGASHVCCVPSEECEIVIS